MGRLAAPTVSGLPHICTICGRAGVWGDGWAWFGSYRMLDEHPERIVKTCSDKCRAEAYRTGRTFR